MGEKAKGYWTKVKEFLKKLPKKIFIALGILVVLALVLVIWLNSRPYSVLFTELNAEDMSSVLTYLEEAGVTNYKVENNDTILVHPSQEANLKAQLLMEGYPNSGFAYTYSTETGALSTESERAAAQLYDLQDRMSAVVRCLDGVKDAVVTINTGEDRSYVLDSDNAMPATASVFVELHDIEMLTTNQADAIRNLVANSVKGLEVSKVSITDNLGNTYTTGADVADGDASALKIQLEQEWENKIRTNVLQVLVPWFGKDNVEVAVHCTVEVSHTTENNTDVFLPEWAADGSTNGRGIVGSRIYDYYYTRDGEEVEGGVVGTTTNSDFPEYVEDLPNFTGDEDTVSLSGQVDYDNSRSEKIIVRTAGVLTDCSVAVTINSDVAGMVSVPEVSQHVARASGIVGEVDEVTGEEYLADRISVISVPFNLDEDDGGEDGPAGFFSEDNWILIAALAGLVLFLIILIIVLLILHSRKKKRLAEEEAERERQELEARLAAEAALASIQASENGADVMSMESERTVILRQDIRKFVEDNPEIAAQMLRGWLRGDDDDA